MGNFLVTTTPTRVVIYYGRVLIRYFMVLSPPFINSFKKIYFRKCCKIDKKERPDRLYVFISFKN